MSYVTEYQRKFDQLDKLLNHRDNSHLKKIANGGKTILFIYPPAEEESYLVKAKELYQGKARFIDISKLFVDYIDMDGWEEFKQYYSDFKETPHIVFKSEEQTEADLFKMIIEEIKKADDEQLIPVLIRTGILYGTGIDNQNIMESKDVMTLSSSLVIFYPAKLESGNLHFLNFKPASKYRCALIS